MMNYESCLCDPDKALVSLEIRGRGVIVTYKCPGCANEIYDTNYTVDDIIEDLNRLR